MKHNSEQKDQDMNVSPTCGKPLVVGSTVYLMDCVAGMKEYPDKWFDLAVVDPPYGIGLAEWDFVKPTLEYFTELWRVSKNQIIFGGNYFAHLLPETESWICWHKKPFLKQQAHFELAWTSFSMKPKMYEYTYAGNAEGLNKVRVDYNKKSIHPAQKPENIYKLIFDDFVNDGDRVLDTHLGSGSSRIAADEMGIDFTGFENDKSIYEAQEKRFKQYKSQLRIEGW